MASTLTTLAAFVQRITNGNYWATYPIWQERVTAPTNNGFGTVEIGIKATDMLAFPALPTGVTAFIPTGLTFIPSTGIGSFIFGRLTNLGTHNFATNTFTDGSVMPTMTEGGTSRIVSSMVIAEVTTGFSAAASTFSFTYKDQDGATPNTSTTLSVSASIAIGSCAICRLASGDYGVQDISACTNTGTPTGIMKFWGIEPLCAGSFYNGGAGGVFPFNANLIGKDLSVLRCGAADQLGGFIFKGSATATSAQVGSLFVVGDN